MLNYSTRFKELIKSDVRNVLYELNITLVDGTQITIDNSALWGDSLTLEDGTSDNDKFTIGAAISTKLTFGINNIYGDFNGLSFDRADVILKIGMMVDETKEMVQVGKFIVDNADYDSSIISITALDNFIKMDSLVSVISFPTTTQTLVQNICSSCGITNMADDFLRDHNYDIIEFDYSNMTYRALLVYLCQYMGCFAKMDSQGRLVLKWYQDIFDDEEHSGIETIDTFSSLKLSTDFIEISGVEVVLDDEHSYSLGTSNYVVVVSNNPIIVDEEMAQALVNRLYVQIGGYKFKKCNVDTLLYLWFESGDVVYIQENETKYPIFISNRTLNSNGSLSFSCDAETPLRNSAVSNDTSASAIRQLRQDLKKEKDDRTRVEEELRQEIAGAGGVYETEVDGPEGEGGKIKYLHNKPLLADSAIQWKFTATTISVSKDYGQTWSFALNSDGQAILNQIYALGINADYVNTGYIKGLKEFKVDVYGVNTTFVERNSYNPPFAMVNTTYVLGKYFANDSSNTYVSDDNQNWTTMTPNIVVNCWCDVGNGKVVGVCNAQKTLVYTTNFLNWETYPNITIPFDVGKMFYVNGALFMANQWAGYYPIYYTTDFENLNTILNTKETALKISYFEKDNAYVVVGQYNIFASHDLVEWTNVYNNVRNCAGVHYIDSTNKYLYLEMNRIFALDSIYDFASATITNIDTLGIEGYLRNSKYLHGVLFMQSLLIDSPKQETPVYYTNGNLDEIGKVTYNNICTLSFSYDGTYYYYSKKNYAQEDTTTITISRDAKGEDIVKENTHYCYSTDSIEMENGVFFKMNHYNNLKYSISISEESNLGGITNSLYLSKNENGETNFYIRNNNQDGSVINEMSASNKTSLESNITQSSIDILNKDGIYGDFYNSLELQVDRTSHFGETETYLRNYRHNIIHQNSFESFDSDINSAQTVIQNFIVGQKITNQISLSNFKSTTYDVGSETINVQNMMSLTNSNENGLLKNKIELTYGTSLLTQLRLENRQENYDLTANKLELISNNQYNKIVLRNNNIGSENEDESNSLELYCQSGTCYTTLKNRRNYLEMYDNGGSQCSVRLHNGQGSYLNLATNNNAELYAWNTVHLMSLNYYVCLQPYKSQSQNRFWFSNDGHIYFCQYESQVGNDLYRVA